MKTLRIIIELDGKVLHRNYRAKDLEDTEKWGEEVVSMLEVLTA